MIWVALASAGLAVAAVPLVLGARSSSSGSPTAPVGPPLATPLSRLPGIDEGPPPWPAERGGLRARLAALGVPTEDGRRVHLHAHLDLLLRGRRVPVPAGIGIAPSPALVAPLHTHDGSGVVHVESPVIRTYTLGEVFALWGVRLSDSCVGGVCARGRERLRVYVNGRIWQGDPLRIALRRRLEIFVSLGATAPAEPPAGYGFPPGF